LIDGYDQERAREGRGREIPYTRGDFEKLIAISIYPTAKENHGEDGLWKQSAV